MDATLSDSLKKLGYEPVSGPSGGWSYRRACGGVAETILVSPALGHASKAVDNGCVSDCPAHLSFDEVSAIASALPRAEAGLTSLGYREMRTMGGAGWRMPRFKKISGDDSWQVDLDPSCCQARMSASGPAAYMYPCAMPFDVLACSSWELRSRGWA